MKFYIAALVGSAVATRYTIPQVSWNQTAIDNVVQGLEKYGQQAVKDDQADKQQLGKDLVNIYSAWEVNNYMTFGKALKPVVQAEVDFLDAFTVNGTCNETTATQCLNSWLIKGAHYHDQAAMETCIKTKAQCATKWDDMTLAQQQALATKYQTSVQNMAIAYKKVHDKIMLKLATAWSDHMKRRQAMDAKFKAAAKTAALGMGCEATCTDACFSKYWNNGAAIRCIQNGLYSYDDKFDTWTKSEPCGCGTNVIKFTPGSYSNYYENDFLPSEDLLQ